MSIGQAAEMAGLSLWDFNAALVRLRVSPINLTASEQADDFVRAGFAGRETL